MSRCLLANKYPWTAAFSSCQFTPTALRGTRVRRARTRIYTPGQNVWQLRAPLCSTCSDRNYAKRRSPRERESGAREWGLPWKQVKKKGKGKRKKGGGETVGEMEKELDSELTNLCKKRVAPRGNNPAPEIL